MKVTVACILGLCLSSTRTALAQPNTAIESKPPVWISGTNSNVNRASYERITKSDDWNRIWARHLGTSVNDAYRPLMDVDFEHYMVVAVFCGEQRQVRQVTVDSLFERSDSITIRYSELGFGWGTTAGKKEKPPAPVYPYAFIVLPKSAKEIVLEEEVMSKDRTAKSLPTEWKEIARLKRIENVSSSR